MNGFLGSAILETAIGAAFLYLLLAVFCTAAVEWVATLLEARAGTLRETISYLLKDQTLKTPTDAAGLSFVEAFYAHPLIASQAADGKHPSYVSPQTFSTAVLDLGYAIGGSLEALPEGAVRTCLLALHRQSKGDIDALQAGVEAWFNDAMRRASLSYKRRTRFWSLAIACVSTIATNADTFAILRRPGFLPGWTGAEWALNPLAWLARLTGWTITIGAVSLGAPFWFDVLSRSVNLRASSKASPSSD